MSSHQQQNDATKQGGFGKIPEDKTGKSNEKCVHQSLARGSTQPFDWEHKSDGKEQKCDEVPGKRPQQQQPRASQMEDLLQKEVDDLRKRMDKLSEEKKKLEKDMKLLQTITNFERERLERYLEEKTMELKKCQTKVYTAETKCKQREKELNDLRAESSNKIQELTAANDDLRTILSKHSGAKLQDKNPNIPDLSDSNRPTKVAERFSELYDNEWTNCFEVLKQNETEVDVVKILLTACVKIYDHCITKASMALEDLHRVFLDFNSDSDIQLQKQLKDRRKKLQKA